MIDFQNVCKLYGTQDVLDNASFRIHPGERVGIVGPNGAGKSTIFSLLNGEISPEKGQITIPNGLRIGYLHQQLHTHDAETTLLDYSENAIPEIRTLQHDIEKLEAQLATLDEESRQKSLSRLGHLQTQFEHLGGYELKHRAEAALTGLGFNPDAMHAPFRSFSGGWKMRAELARTLIARPDILLLDEPTNYLDVPAVEWLRDYLRDFPGTLLLISHDRYLLNALTQVTIEVAGAQVARYPGNYDYYIHQRQDRYEQLAAAKRNQDRKREQVERFVERFRSKNTKASQVQSRIKTLEKMDEIKGPVDLIQSPKITLPEPPRCSAEIIRLAQAGFSYDGARWIFRDLDLRIEQGLRIAVVGLNGMGKTTLLRALAGKLPLQEGDRVLGANVTVGYMAQDFTDVMDPEKTVFATARDAAGERSDGDVRSLLGSFRFSGNDSIEKPVKVLSGGEKMRLGLCRILLNPPNFLILDEPTTHLDIGTRESLEDALRNFKGTICFVSHDIEFVRNVANTIFSIGPDGFTRYFGGYAYYRDKLRAEQEAAVAEATEALTAETGSAQDRKAQKRLEAERRQQLSKLRKPLEKQLADCENRLENLEEEQADLLEQMADPDNTQDMPTISRRLGEIQSEIATVTDQWENTALELEELSSLS